MYFNQGTCSHNKSHDTRGVRYIHVCSVCFANGKTFPHSETDCKNKLKKRVNVGTTWAGYSPYSHRFVYSKGVENVQMEAKATKSVALSWFHRCRMFDTTTPSKSYAQTLKNNSTVPVVENIVIHNSKTKEKHLKNSFQRKMPSSTAIRITHDCTPLTVAGVPVKYGKCVHSKYSVRSTRLRYITDFNVYKICVLQQMT